jgi:hypothetical protein
MNLRRKLVGHIVAILVLVGLIVSLMWGLTTLTDVSAALAFTLVGAVVAILFWTWRPEINQWFSERSQPILNIALTEVRPEEEVRRVQVWFPNGQMRSHEARFCFITITNSGKRTAEEVKLWCHSQMLLMPFKHKADYRVDHEWSVEEFDKSLRERRYGDEEMDVETFVVATMDGVEQIDSIDIPPNPRGETLVLFFTMKDFAPLCVPGFTRIYEHPRGTPPTVKLNLEVEHKDGVGTYEAEFEIIMETWNKFAPKLVKVNFVPYTYS